MKKRLRILLAAAMLCLATGAQAEMARVRSGSISKTVFGTGEIQPHSQPGVYAEIDAEVVEWYYGMGDTVKAGDVLIILEAMKMENEIVAPRDGTVAQVVTSKGAVVDTGAPLVVLA